MSHTLMSQVVTKYLTEKVNVKKTTFKLGKKLFKRELR